MSAGKHKVDYQPTRQEIIVVVGVVMACMLLPSFNIMALTTALPVIVSELGDLSNLSWVVTSYLLAATVSVPLYGKISDIYGRKPVLYVAIIAFLIGSLLSGLAQTMTQLITFRALQGVGGGGLVALSQALVGDVIPPRHRGKYHGYLGIVFAVATLTGPLAGGFFVDHLSWRWIFFTSVPLGLGALAVARRNLRIEHPRRERRIDYQGATLLTVATVCIVLISDWGGIEHEWGSARIIGLAAAAVVSIGLLVVVERRAPEPILPVELFKNRIFTAGSVVGFIVGTTMFGTFVFVPLFLQGALGVSATDSGLLMVPLTFGVVASSIVSGRLVTRWGRYRIFPVSGTALSVVGFALLTTLDSGSGVGEVAAYLALLGAAIGMIMQIVIVAIQNAVDPSHLGAATSTSHFFRMIGGTVGVAAFGTILHARTSRILAGSLPSEWSVSDVLDDPARVSGLPPSIRLTVENALAEGTTLVFGLAALVSILSFVAALFLREIPLRDHRGSPSMERSDRFPSTS